MTVIVALIVGALICWIGMITGVSIAFSAWEIKDNNTNGKQDHQGG